ncbi:hypothetical protein IH785_11890 [candidate division KSB1 bacterium]|nr:hypothetical protein [candidate division KSB1 bacterium]
MNEIMESVANTIFVGIQINEKLQDQLDSSKPSMKQFFEENSPEYLQIVQIDSDEYLGKISANCTTMETLTNISMNMKTMLKMICPKFIFSDSAIKVIALSPASTGLSSHGY